MAPGTAAIDPTRLPRPVAAVIVAAIAGATLLALFWPALPFGGPTQVAVAPTKVGVITRQVDNSGAGRINEPAPDFEWVAPDGRRVALSALRPKPVVINFWATWCEPCKREMPLLDATAAAHPDVVFLAVDLDEDGDRIRAFFDQVGLSVIEPLLDIGLATSRRYGLASVPSTFFVDAGGTIRHMQVGEMDAEDLERGLGKIR